MTRFPGLRRFMRLDRGSQGVERAVEDELRFHFEMTVAELRARGLDDAEARREAERRFGDVIRTRRRLATIDRAHAHQQRRAEWWSALAQDLRYAARGLRLKPGFAAGIVITLGLGIGANASMFGIVDRLLFRPPAFLAAPERTNHLYLARMIEGKEFVAGSAQYQRFLDFAKDSRTMEVLGAYAQARRAVGTGDATKEVDIGAMSASMWQLFDAKPVLGRFFGASEDRYPDVSHVIVLSYGYWQTQFAGDRSVVGKPMMIGSAQFTIIGVAPRGFSAVDMIAPIGFVPLMTDALDGFGRTMWDRYRTTYNVTWLNIYGRRKPGASVEAAAADLTEAYRRSWTAQRVIQPKTPTLAVAKPRVVVGSIIDQRGPNPSADSKVAAWLLGVASMVLLIACANVGNLLLSRAFKRRREIAVRIALGVGRLRLISQLLIESLLLAVLGAAAGLAVAQWGGGIVRATLMPQVDWGSAIVDRRVLAFAGVCALVAGVLAGLAPIVEASRSDVITSLKAGAREGFGRRSRVLTSLLVLQATLSVVLLVGAGLFVRSLVRVEALHVGYDIPRLVNVELHMRGLKADSAQAVQLRRDLIARGLRLPFVENGAPMITVPFRSTYSDDAVGIGTDSAHHVTDVITQIASPSYFATMGTRLLRGRNINEDDRVGGALVAIVNETLARVAWPNQDPIGRCVKMSADTMPCRTVVGIAEDVKLSDFAAPADPMLYVPAQQLRSEKDATLTFRVRGDAAVEAEVLRRDLQRAMPGASYVTVDPFAEIVVPTMRSWRLGATMFTIFGGLALLLAGIGLYSVIAYSVAQRAHEMGVRVALGARARDVVMMIVRDAVSVAAAGLVLGLLAALATSRWVGPMLFEISPRDPLVYAIVTLVLLGVAVAASWIPAARAARVDPSVALRAD
jgi:putative ABC transport system permease protein